MLNEPRDFVSSIFAMMIGKHLVDDETREKVSQWKMDVLIETNFYPILVHFENGVTITRDVTENPTIRIGMDFDTIVTLLDGRTSMIREYFRRNIKIDGLLRHPRSTLRFYGFMKSLVGG